MVLNLTSGATSGSGSSAAASCSVTVPDPADPASARDCSAYGSQPVAVQLTGWLPYANNREHRRIGGRPARLWEQDAAALLPLPPSAPEVRFQAAGQAAAGLLRAGRIPTTT